MKEIFDSTFPGKGGAAVTITDGKLRTWGSVAQKREVPCSTIKLVLALLALDAKLIKDENEVWHFTGKKSGRPEWDRDLSLKEALIVSAEWYFQDVARKLGAERFRARLKQLDYGSGWRGKDPALAWHDGSLLISPREQAELALRLAQDKLPFSPEIQATVKRCLTYDTKSPIVLWGKTGSSAKERDGRSLGWYVGAFTKDGKTTAFAILRHAPDTMGPKVRAELVKRLS